MLNSASCVTCDNIQETRCASGAGIGFCAPELLLVFVALAGCSRSNEDPLEQRVARLEEQVARLESDMAVKAVPLASQRLPTATPQPSAEAASCAEAKRAARALWAKVLPTIEEEIATQRTIYQSTAGCCPHVPEHPACGVASAGCRADSRLRALQTFVAQARAARDACSSGAFKLRDAANAAKPPSGSPIDIKGAQEASAAAFEVCKDLDP